MRALCSARGAAAAAGTAGAGLPGGARLLALRLPARAQPLHFVVDAKARVKDLKQLTDENAQLHGLSDTGLFGLAILQNGEYLFVEEENKLSKYAPKSWRSSHTHGLDVNGKPLLELHLVIQFHIESPILLNNDVERSLYFLQLKDNIRTRDALPAETLLLLTGLALQAEYGDATTYEDRDYFKVEDYAPPSFAGDWVSAAMRACHKEHKGLSKVTAETRYIREVCLLPDTINSHRYRLKQNKSEPDPGTIMLLVTAKGIKVLPESGLASNFIWSSIGKLSFDRKKFEIRTEKNKVTLYATSDEKCKYLFTLCKNTHQFSMKIAPKYNEVVNKEEEERKLCYGYSKSSHLHSDQNKNDQRISLISSTSSNTTSGIVSDRVQSEDELEIMIDSPPAPSTESLAFAHLLDCSNSYFNRHVPKQNTPNTKTSSLQIPKTKSRKSKSKECNAINKTKDSFNSFTETSQTVETSSLPDENSRENVSNSPISTKLKCSGSQCSSSCSTVVMAKTGLSSMNRASNASSLELGYSHTAQNSVLSDNSTNEIESRQNIALRLYDEINQTPTIAASSETSGIYTMGSSELTTESKTDTFSDGSRTEYSSTHYGSYSFSNNNLADIDSVSSILKNKSFRQTHSTNTLMSHDPLNSDCVDSATHLSKTERHTKSEENEDLRIRKTSSISTITFHNDGSSAINNKHTLLSASELSDLIVGRGVYPKDKSVSDTLDSVSDYVRLPLSFSGESYLNGHEDTAPCDDNYSNDSFFDRPPTPPARIDSRKLNLSLPNILDVNVDEYSEREKTTKPPPPYEYNHKTSTQTKKAPPAYPENRKLINVKRRAENEEVAARVVTTKPMITILKAEAGDVNTSIERTFASPMLPEHSGQKLQKSKHHHMLNRRAERSRLSQTENITSPKNTGMTANSNLLVAMMKLPPPPPPPRRNRLPPPPPIPRLPPPPPPHNPLFHQQLYSDVDYVYYPLQDPAISQQNYLDHKLTESRLSFLNKNNVHYRSTPFLSTSGSVSSVYGSVQNLSDSYVQLPGTRSSWYSLNSRASLSNYSLSNVERLPISTLLQSTPDVHRVRSDENILNAIKNPPPIKTRRIPPPPPPYEHKKKLLKTFETNNPQVKSEVTGKVKDSCELDIKTLREKSKNLDLPLIAALCNDRSLLKQTKAFGPSKLNKQVSGCESNRNCSKTTDNLYVRCKQESSLQNSQKRTLLRNPTDKLPAIPGSESHTPRAKCNTYVPHPT